MEPLIFLSGLIQLGRSVFMQQLKAFARLAGFLESFAELQGLNACILQLLPGFQSEGLLPADMFPCLCELLPEPGDFCIKSRLLGGSPAIGLLLKLIPQFGNNAGQLFRDMSCAVRLCVFPLFEMSRKRGAAASAKIFSDPIKGGSRNPPESY